MTSWDDVHDAVQSAFARASGLAPELVIWKWQNAGAPPLDYIALSFGSLATIGIDYLKTTTDLTRPRGQEVKIEVRGVREMALELECFTSAVVKERAALALSERIKTSLLLPSIRDQLTAVNLSPFDPGPSNYIPDIVAVGFRGRAHCTIRCYVPAPMVAEYTGFIERVTGTITAKGGTPDPKVIPYSIP